MNKDRETMAAALGDLLTNTPHTLVSEIPDTLRKLSLALMTVNDRLGALENAPWRKDNI